MEAAIGTCREIFGIFRLSAFIGAQDVQDSVHGSLSHLGLTPGVTTSHELMKYMENDEYFILFMRHFPCPSPMEFIHQHPIKWIHQCIFTPRDITWHWLWGEIYLYPSHKINFDIIFFLFSKLLVLNMYGFDNKTDLKIYIFGSDRSPRKANLRSSVRWKFV